MHTFPSREAWLTTVLMTGWLEKFPRLKCAVLESNAFQRAPGTSIADPHETFYRRCAIAFEGDEETLYRLWDTERLANHQPELLAW